MFNQFLWIQKTPQSIINVHKINNLLPKKISHFTAETFLLLLHLLLHLLLITSSSCCGSFCWINKFVEFLSSSPRLALKLVRLVNYN